MKRFEFTKDYGKNKTGDVVEMDLNIYNKVIHPLLMRGILKVIQKDKAIREVVKKEVNKLPEDIVESLKWKKMSDLRKLGGPYGAKDTSKIELIEEIIEKVPKEKIKEFLEVI